MKLNKILLSIPALGCIVLPLTSCNKNQSQPVTIDITSEKTQKTPIAERYVVYEFKASRNIEIGNVTYTVKNQQGSITTAVRSRLTQDEEDKSILYLIILLDDSAIGGQYCTFDIDFIVEKQYETSITGLKTIFMDEHNILPDEAFTFNGTILTGLNESFDTSDYDTLKVPSKTTEIQQDAFKDKFTSTTNKSVKNLCLDHSITINENAFKGCNNFETIDVATAIESSSTITIKTGAFEDWSQKGSISYPKSTTYNEVLDISLCDAGLNSGWFDTTIVRCVPTSDLTIDNKSVKANWTLTNMPRHLSVLCNTLDMSNMDITSIADNAFFDKNGNKTLLSENIDTLVLPTNLTKIGKQAFAYSNLSKTIDSATKKIVNYVEIPSKVTNICESAFYSTKSLGYIVLNEGLLTIESQALASTGLYGINIPSTVTTIGDNAFGESTNMVSIDVTAFKTNTPAPEGWSTTAFSDLPDEGWISCDPTNAKNWSTYFSNFVTIQKGAWQITDDVNLLKTYTPAQAPKDPAIYATISDLMESFVKDLQENPLIIFDDIIWTVQKHINANEYDVFNLKVNNLSADQLNNTITFMLTYRVKFKNNERTYTGYMYFANMSVNTLSAYKSKKPDQFDLTFSDILAEHSSTVEIYEVDDQGTEIINKYYKSATFPTSYSVENFGNVLNKIKLFKFDESSKPTFDIYSVYLRQCGVNE